MHANTRRIGIAITILGIIAFLAIRIVIIEVWCVPEIIGVVEKLGEEPGAPLPRATVLVVDQSGLEYRAYTDDRGRFHLQGTKDFVVGPSLDMGRESTLTVTNLDHKPVILKLDIAHGELSASRPPTKVFVKIRLASLENQGDSDYETYRAMAGETVLPEWASNLESFLPNGSP